MYRMLVLSNLLTPLLSIIADYHALLQFFGFLECLSRHFFVLEILSDDFMFS